MESQSLRCPDEMFEYTTSKPRVTVWNANCAKDVKIIPSHRHLFARFKIGNLPKFATDEKYLSGINRKWKKRKKKKEEKNTSWRNWWNRKLWKKEKKKQGNNTWSRHLMLSAFEDKRWGNAVSKPTHDVNKKTSLHLLEAERIATQRYSRYSSSDTESKG